ncbi:hypothetical protein GCM10028801_34980 [Nocardioides maradonensis]
MYLDPHDSVYTPVLLRRELLAAGHSDRSLARDLQRGVLARPRRGAYVDGPRWNAMTSEQRYAVRCHAAYRNASTDVVLSHTSALPFLGAPLWGLSLSEIHLTRTDGRTGRREAGVRQHRGAIGEADVIRENGLLVMAPARATLEVVTVGSVEAAVVVANHFLHANAFSLGGLAARFDDPMDHWPNSLRTRVVMRLLNPRIESVGESRLFYFFWNQRLPLPEPQFEVVVDGVVIARLDFALPDFGIWFEFDGRIKYVKLKRDGESTTDVVVREKQREERIAELTGWRCVRVTWKDLAEPERLAWRIRALIESGGSRRRTS